MSILIEKLVEFRDSQSKKEGLEGYKVLQFLTIEEIAKILPQNLTELGKIKGIGPAKLKKYGEDILKLVAEPALRVPLDAGAPGAEKQIIGVSEYLDYLNLVFQKTADIKIRGEISSLKEYPSGLYFTLKDQGNESVMNCFLPLYTYRGLGLPVEEGLEVVVEGMPRMVKRNGRFQFTVEALDLAGEGTLKRAYEFLKNRFEIDGLFARKRKLPECIGHIGVITSRNGAVIHDFNNNLDNRGIKVYLKDVRVEGAQAIPQIVEAIRLFNRTELALDCIVIMRGGGSLEDLQAFNSETVVKEIFASSLPVIAAIGHDADVPLACLAADVYTSTPTAAATQVVNKSWVSAIETISKLSFQLTHAYSAKLNASYKMLSRSATVLVVKLQTIFEKCTQVRFLLDSRIFLYLDWLARQNIFLQNTSEKFVFQMRHAVISTNSSIRTAENFLANASPERSLKLGYSILRTEDGKIIKGIANIRPGVIVNAQLGNGEFDATVINVREE